MPATISPVYDELIEALSQEIEPKRILAFQLSPQKQLQVDDLLAKNREGTLSSDEAAELDGFSHFEHVVRMLKARALLASKS